jgi:hypothetical protein
VTAVETMRAEHHLLTGDSAHRIGLTGIASDDVRQAVAVEERRTPTFTGR